MDFKVAAHSSESLLPEFYHLAFHVKICNLFGTEFYLGYEVGLQVDFCM